MFLARQHFRLRFSLLKGSIKAPEARTDANSREPRQQLTASPNHKEMVNVTPTAGNTEYLVFVI